MKYQYKMKQLPAKLTASPGQSKDHIAAEFLEQLVNEMSEQGWEFDRLDPFTVEKPVGCFASLNGAKSQALIYNIATFRKPAE
ncbi:MAG: DUF4177 domain-containing protein [bacterium]|nr:DUF4177 domain-containing protein [bacterium]